MIKLIISSLNVSFKKLIVWLQLHPKLIASDYITTVRPLGRTKGVHSCVTPQGAWGGGNEAWLTNPSSLTYFNTNGRVRALGKTSSYEEYLSVLSAPDGPHVGPMNLATRDSLFYELTRRWWIINEFCDRTVLSISLLVDKHDALDGSDV